MEKKTLTLNLNLFVPDDIREENGLVLEAKKGVTDTPRDREA